MVFVSYSREDKNEVVGILNDIEGLGYKTWLDNELSGGQQWWDQILKNIRSADIFIFMLSHKSIDSFACKSEYEYAEQLGIPILPILISDNIVIEHLPPTLSKVQLINYKKETDKNFIKQLAKAMRNLEHTKKELTKPLPEPPKVPISYMGELIEKVEFNKQLSINEQRALIMEIKEYKQKNNSQKELLDLLDKFKNRNDLFASILKEIKQLEKPDKISYTKKFFYTSVIFVILLIVGSIYNNYKPKNIKPSFDCKNAKSYVEKQICSSEELALLDNKLDNVYKDTIKKISKKEKNSLEKKEEQWVKDRDNTCENSDDNCIKNFYNKRIIYFKTYKPKVNPLHSEKNTLPELKTSLIKDTFKEKNISNAISYTKDTINEKSTSDIVKSEKSTQSFNIKNQIEPFLNNYIHANRSDMTSLPKYFINPVEEYFKLGSNISHKKILKDEKEYLEIYPVSQYKIFDFDILKEYLYNKKKYYELLVNIQWSVTSKRGKKSEGTTKQWIKLKRLEDSFLIVSIRMVNRASIGQKNLNICYKYKYKNKYYGCIQKSSLCKNMESFGQNYLNTKSADNALIRCLVNNPNTNLATVYKLKKSGDNFLALRKDPKISNNEIMSLYTGDLLNILEKKEKWYKVNVIRNGKVGWAYSKYIKEIR